MKRIRPNSLTNAACTLLHTIIATCAVLVFAGSADELSIVSPNIAPIRLVSEATAAIPPQPGVFNRHRQQEKGRCKGTPPRRSFGSHGKAKKKRSVDLSHPHNTKLKRYQHFARRRLRHKLLCGGCTWTKKTEVGADATYRNDVRGKQKRPGTRFTLRLPNTKTADEMYRHMRNGEEIPFNYDCAGMTRPTKLVPTSAAALGSGRANGDSSKDHGSDYSLDKYCWPDAKITDDDSRRNNGGWRILRYRQCVGYGPKCYKRVRRAVLDWEFATVGQEESARGGRGMSKGQKATGIIRAKDTVSSGFGTDATTTGRVQSISLNPCGRRMVTFTECRYIGLPTFYAVNPVASVYGDIVDQRCSNGDMFTSTAYGTVGNHLLSGEERVTVLLRNSVSENDHDRPVHIEIRSYSRPAPTLAGKIVWPFIGRMQNGFFKAELNHFIEIGKSEAAA